MQQGAENENASRPPVRVKSGLNMKQSRWFTSSRNDLRPRFAVVFRAPCLTVLLPINPMETREFGELVHNLKVLNFSHWDAENVQDGPKLAHLRRKLPQGKRQ